MSVVEETSTRRWDPASTGVHLGLLALVFAVHRGWLLLRLHEPLRRLLDANPDTLAWSYLTLPALRDHLGASLWHLQQSPPVPNLVVGLLLKITDWPLGVTLGLVTLQMAASGAATLLLYLLVRRTLGWRWGALALALVFALGPDLAVMEFDRVGQGLDTVTMALVTAIALGMLRQLEAPRAGRGLVLGLAAALLALTRAAFSYYPWLVVTALAVLAPRRRWRHAACCALGVLALQGTWCLRGAAVYGEARWATSTWAGGNLVAGLDHAGLGDAFRHDFLAHRERRPGWVVDAVEALGLVTWDPRVRHFAPPELLAEDERLDRRLHGTNRFESSVVQRQFLDAYAAAYPGFALRHPGVVLRKLRLGYKLSWFPVRYHASKYLAPLAVDWRSAPDTWPWTVAADLAAGRLPEPTYLQQGTWPRLERVPVDLPTLDVLGIVAWQAQLYLLHLAVPVAALVVLWRRRRRSLRPAEGLFLFALATYAYSAGLQNLVEFGENMRFRLATEPLTWWLSVYAVHVLWRAARRRREPADAVEATA